MKYFQVAFRWKHAFEVQIVGNLACYVDMGMVHGPWTWFFSYYLIGIIDCLLYQEVYYVVKVYARY